MQVENAIDENNEDPTLVDFELAVKVLTDLKKNKYAKVPKIERGVRKDWVEGLFVNVLVYSNSCSAP